MDYTIFNFAWDMFMANAPTVAMVGFAFVLMHVGFGMLNRRIDRKGK